MKIIWIMKKLDEYEFSEKSTVEWHLLVVHFHFKRLAGIFFIRLCLVPKTN